MTSKSTFTDPIENDFAVKKIFDSPNVSFYAATKGGLWHFVWANRSIANPETPNFSNFSINQTHIPRYMFALELRKRLHYIDQIPTEDIDSSHVLVGNIFWPGFYIGINSERRVMLVSERGSAYPLESAEPIAIEDIARLNQAENQTQTLGDSFFLPEALTNSGNPVSYDNKHLINSIAFERQIHGELDPINRFEIFSAFCTLVDSPLSRKIPKDYIETLVLEQNSIDPDDMREEVAAFLFNIQESLLPGTPVLGEKEGTVSDAVIRVVAEIFSQLNDSQRCQYVLLRDLHRALLLINLAIVQSEISFDTYCETMTLEVAPDSVREQTIRSQAAFVQLLGALA